MQEEILRAGRPRPIAAAPEVAEGWSNRDAAAAVPAFLNGTVSAGTSGLTPVLRKTQVAAPSERQQDHFFSDQMLNRVRAALRSEIGRFRTARHRKTRHAQRCRERIVHNWSGTMKQRL